MLKQNWNSLFDQNGLISKDSWRKLDKDQLREIIVKRLKGTDFLPDFRHGDKYTLLIAVYKAVDERYFRQFFDEILIELLYELLSGNSELENVIESEPDRGDSIYSSNLLILTSSLTPPNSTDIAASWAIRNKEWIKSRSESKRGIRFVTHLLSIVLKHDPALPSGFWQAFLEFMPGLAVEGMFRSTVWEGLDGLNYLSKKGQEREKLEFIVFGLMDLVVSIYNLEIVKQEILKSWRTLDLSLKVAMAKWFRAVKNIKIEAQGRFDYVYVSTLPGKFLQDYDPLQEPEKLNLDAFYNGDRPPHNKFTIPLDLIPDHALIKFAEHKGFFRWHNIQLTEDSSLIFPDGHKKLFDTEKADALVVAPRVFLDEMVSTSQDFAVTNIFRGFTLIGPDYQEIRPFDPNSSESSFLDLMTRLYDKKARIGVIDDGGERFVDLLKRIYKARKQKVIGNVYPELVPLDQNKDSLIESLNQKKVDFIISHVSTIALASQANLRTYFEFSDLVDFIEGVEDKKKGVEDKKRRDFLWKRIGSLTGYALHNCWNINISSENWKKPEYNELILRLASIAFFTIDYLSENRKEVIEYLANEWNRHHKEPFQLEYDSLKMAFNKSYDFIALDNCKISYFDESSGYYYPASLAASFQIPDGQTHTVSNFHNVLSELIKYKHSYEEERKKFDLILKDKTLTDDAKRKIKSLMSRVERHAKVRNYPYAYRGYQSLNKSLMEA